MEIVLFSALGNSNDEGSHLSVADALVGQQGALCRDLHFKGEGAEGACMEVKPESGKSDAVPSVSLKEKQLQAQIQRAPLSRVL